MVDANNRFLNLISASKLEREETVERAQPAPYASTPTSATPRRGQVVIPTNTVTTRDGLTVRARIDASLSVTEIIKQLCLNLKIPGNPLMFALRDGGEGDELVTDENLRKKIRDRAALKLVNAPVMEAIAIIDALKQRERFVSPNPNIQNFQGDEKRRAEEEKKQFETNFRLCLFNLQRYIKEEQFVTEFLQREGLKELCEVILVTGGNVLAYALTALSNLLDLPFGWSSLSPNFIHKIVQILASPNNLINVCRPATLILKKLVEADPSAGPGNAPGTSATERLPPPPGSVYRFGFDVVYEEMKREQGLLDVVVGRLGGAESSMVLYSMTLINSLLSHATPQYWSELTSQLERLQTSRTVIRLMSSHTIEELSNSILDYQGNLVRILYNKKNRPVLAGPSGWGNENEDGQRTPGSGMQNGYGDGEQEAILDYIWLAAKIDEDSAEYYGDESAKSRGKGSVKDLVKWRKLGFETEDLRREFEGTGMLGLECFKQFVQSDQSRFAQLVLEQNSRALDRRCPIAKASNEVVEILSEHWNIFAPGYSTSTTFQPFLLSFYRVHVLALLFFLRMWGESGATATDFTRVASLVVSQVKVALAKEAERPWHEVEQDFLESEYRSVRDRQMKELELEDDLLNKVPVRNLRAKLYKESYEFIRQQRIQCLLQGAWFANGIPLALPPGGLKRRDRPWRYMRLDRNLKWIYYCDSAVKFPVRSGLEDLPDKIDVSQISEIAIHSCALPPNINVAAGPLQSFSDVPNLNLAASPISFSLLSVRGGESLGDHVAADASGWADWTDGLNMLRRDGGHVATSETAGYVHALTEIGLKIKLLDLSGEKVDIPSSLDAGPPPADTNFFFSDL